MYENANHIRDNFIANLNKKFRKAEAHHKHSEKIPATVDGVKRMF